MIQDFASDGLYLMIQSCISIEYILNVSHFNATFNNISVISWLLALLVEETGVHGEKTPFCRMSLNIFNTNMNDMKQNIIIL
jgi:hypothetical protein